MVPEYANDVAVFITAIAALGAVIAGILQFRSSARLSAMTPFLTKRLELYEEITRLTGLICSTPDADGRRDAIAKFWSLYFGPMALVEDQEVEKSMIEFGRLLEESEAIDSGLLETAALELAVACRVSVSDSWRLNLDPLIKRTV